MKVLTICQPYAAAIIFGPKRIENRKWYCSHRGPLAIHAGKSRKWLGTLSDEEKADWPQWNDTELVFGAIIGVVTVTECHDFARKQYDNPWACGPYCIELWSPRVVLPTVAMPGKLGLWEVDETKIPDLHYYALTR